VLPDRIPAETVVPRCRCLAALSVRVPAPSLVRTPVPDMTPGISAGVVWLKVTLALLVMSPCSSWWCPTGCRPRRCAAE